MYIKYIFSLGYRAKNEAQFYRNVASRWALTTSHTLSLRHTCQVSFGPVQNREIVNISISAESDTLKPHTYTIWRSPYQMDLKHLVCSIMCMCMPSVQFKACNLGWDSAVRVRSLPLIAESVSDVGLEEMRAFTGLSDGYLPWPLSSSTYLEVIPPACWLTLLPLLCFITVYCSDIEDRYLLHDMRGIR